MSHATWFTMITLYHEFKLVHFLCRDPGLGPSVFFKVLLINFKNILKKKNNLKHLSLRTILQCFIRFGLKFCSNTVVWITFSASLIHYNHQNAAYCLIMSLLEFMRYGYLIIINWLFHFKLLPTFAWLQFSENEYRSQMQILVTIIFSVPCKVVINNVVII